MIHQIDPQLTMYVPHMDDEGIALFLIDYCLEEDLYWVIAMKKDGAIWTLPNKQVRMTKNITVGRPLKID